MWSSVQVLTALDVRGRMSCVCAFKSHRGLWRHLKTCSTSNLRSPSTSSDNEPCHQMQPGLTTSSCPRQRWVHPVLWPRNRSSSLSVIIMQLSQSPTASPRVWNALPRHVTSRLRRHICEFSALVSRLLFSAVHLLGKFYHFHSCYLLTKYFHTLAICK